MNNSNVFFTADLHFSHRNIIKYCNRPWIDITEMNQALVDLWNKTVSSNDVVYVLGDFSLNPKVAQSYVQQLNGIKHLIVGNHDAPFPAPYNKKADKMKQMYLNDGWASVEYSKEITLKNGTNVVMVHMPSDTIFDNRHSELRILPKPNQVVLHGHLHGRYQKKDNQIDVGLDVDLKLFTEDDVIKVIEDPRSFIPSRLEEFYKTRECGDEKT